MFLLVFMMYIGFYCGLVDCIGPPQPRTPGPPPPIDGPESFPGPDWCQYALDGNCDEHPIGYECPVGSDTTDCADQHVSGAVEELEQNIEKESPFPFTYILYQAMFSYCLCLYYQKIMSGILFIRNNSDIILEIIVCLVKCVLYILIFISSITLAISSFGDVEKEDRALKLFAVIAFVDYLQLG